MKIEKKALESGQVELTITVDKSDASKSLEKAASHLSTHRPLKGFRPGKAPYNIVEREFGEATIIQEALEDIINESFDHALNSENLHTYGKVEFNLLPLPSSSAVVAYKAVATIMPKVKLGKWQDKKISRNKVDLSDEDINKALAELAQMLITETPSTNQARLTDKVIVDFEVMVDGKIIEGGSAKGFGLILGEGKMIPGFEEQLIGKKTADKLEFELNFPADYHAKNLSGKPAKFKVDLLQILNRNTPPINDELAKRVGTSDLNDLKNHLRKNILKEKEQQEEEKIEIAAIKQLVDSGEFDKIPPVMIADSVDDLVQDFRHSLAHQGTNFDQYLQAIGKTLDQIKKEFEPKALERVKSSMALGQLAEDEQMNVTASEIETELREYTPEEQNKPEVRRHAANLIINRKLIKFIKDKIIKT